MKALAFILWLVPTAGFSGERILTHGSHGHLIHNIGVFSPDGQSIVFDSRNDETQLATSRWIGTVDVTTGEESVLYQTGGSDARAQAVGAASYSPVANAIAFLQGLGDSSTEVPYSPQRRSGMLISPDALGKPRHLDARDVTLPFTPGALRGGTHAHQWAGDGTWLSFTYNDAVVVAPGPAPADLRTVGVTVLEKPVAVSDSNTAGDFSGEGFSVVVVKVTSHPAPGSDAISRAYDEGWVGSRGYLRPDGTRQTRALAFLGDIVAKNGKPNSEVFIADLPADLSTAAPGEPLEGSQTGLPNPPAGVVVRRLTHTENTAFPGLQGPRHWVRASPDGATVAFLDQDPDGIVQIFGISPNGGEPRQISRLVESVDTPFSWSPDGKLLACSSGGRVVLVSASGKAPVYLTDKNPDGHPPLHGVVFSPDGKRLAFNRLLPGEGEGLFLQICLVEVPVSGPDQ